MDWLPAYVGLGSNLDDPPARVRAALAALGSLPATRLERSSRMYGSAPLGRPDQPDYCNAVAALVTRLPPDALLGQLQELEARLGKAPAAERWGPRVIDLDLLSMSDLRVAGASLQLPHPGIAQRAFVLFPWREIAPDYLVPGLGPVQALAARLPPDAATVLA
jgi:2-amino-4-hydroxy-6-hydroxymethyldihydropteridine diphosphokinase